MRAVSASEAGEHFSELLEEVRRGETILVTAQGQPVAELRPTTERAGPERDAAWDRLFAHLAEQPILNLPRINRDELYDDR